MNYTGSMTQKANNAFNNAQQCATCTTQDFPTTHPTNC